MKIGMLGRILLAASPLMAGIVTGCGDFWAPPPCTDCSTSFTLSNGGNISASQLTSLITVTPGSSFTGTVTLTCAVTGPSSVSTSLFPSCSLSPTSVSITGTSAAASTLTATIGASTPSGTYNITVTGASGSISPSPTTVVCVAVGTGSCSSSASNSGNFYILTESSLAGYSVSNSSLTAISSSSYTLTGASAMAIDPSGSYLWVGTSSGITPYKIGSGGTLTQGSVVFNDNVSGALKVDPSGKWLLDASLSGILFAYPITTSGTQDTSRSIQSNIQLASDRVQPNGIAISPSGSTNPIIAVALGVTSGTEVFPFTPGSATPISTPYTPTISPYGQSGVAASVSVAIDPSNSFLYIGETDAFPNSSTGDSGALRVFKISSSSLTEISYSSGSPTVPYASGGSSPLSIVAASSGYIYVANWQGTSSGDVTSFKLNASTPALTLQSSTATTGTEPYSMTEDGTGDFLLVVNNQGSPYFNAFSISTSNPGQLNTSATGSTASGPVTIVAVP